jgi:hypothetical protein
MIIQLTRELVMKYTRHGLSVAVERIEQECFLSITIAGKLTHEDYETMVPMLESALEGIKQPKIKVFMDARELEGWELHAAWDDFKMGIKHRTEFCNIIYKSIIGYYVKFM